MSVEGTKLLSVISELWPERAEKSVVKVSGISMQPLLLDGESIVVDHTTRDLKFGDIGVFDRGGMIIVHRVLLKRRIGRKISYRTKGDWILYMDPPLEARAVLGRVTSMSRQGKKYDLNLKGSIFYARLMALYSFFIAIDGKLAYLLDRGLFWLGKGIFRRKIPEGARFFRALFLGADRFFQRIFHRLFFRFFHRIDPGNDFF